MGAGRKPAHSPPRRDFAASDRLSPKMPHGRTLAIAALLVAALAPTAAQARTPPPKLTGLRCVPATRAVCHPRPQVMIGKQVQLRGTGFKAGMRVSFRWSKGALATKLRRSPTGWVARVPPGTKAGTISVRVTDRAGRRSRVIRLVVLPVPASSAGRPAARSRRRSPATGCGSGSCRRARAGTSTPSRRGRGRPASQPSSSRARTARTMRGRSSTRRWSRPCTRMASTCARGSSSTAPIRSARRRRARAPWRRAPTASSSTPRAATRGATRRRSSTSPRCGPPSDPRIRSG